jgi:MFS superfamily sulfate permease-like transporter
MDTYFKTNFNKDLLSSIVVFLVALPLCMGIAIASGVPPVLGLISGIVGGVVVGSFSGSPLQVSGPAAGLAVMVFEAINKFGVEVLIPLGIFVGIFQFSIYVFRLADYFKAITPSLVKGLLSGIGVLILISQLYVAVDGKPIGNGLQNIMGLTGLFSGLFSGESGNLSAFIVAMGALVSIPVWQKVGGKLSKIIPGPLFAVFFATFLGVAFSLKIKFISIPTNILSELNFISKDSFNLISPGFLATALAMAIVATAETLLSVKAVDQMTGSTSDYNKEIRAQGLGNFIAGIFGALPITGVIVRSSANVESGAKTRGSAIIHGFWLIIIVFIFGDILKNVPNSTLAGILIFTGLKLLDIKSIPALIQKSKTEAVVYFITMGLVVCVNLLTGVLVGFVCSLFLIAKKPSRLGLETVETSTDKVEFKLSDQASFVSIPKISKALGRLKKGSITIDLKSLTYIDWAVEEQINSWKKTQEQRGLSITLNK